MRCVTFDCTVLSVCAARLMPPAPATAAKTERSPASIANSPLSRSYRHRDRRDGGVHIIISDSFVQNKSVFKDTART